MMKIYFDNAPNRFTSFLHDDLVLQPYRLDLDHKFEMNYLGSYPVEMAVGFTQQGFYYSDYGIRDNYEVYYVEISADGKELYFYDVHEVREEDEE